MRVPYFESCFLEFCEMSVRDVGCFGVLSSAAYRVVLRELPGVAARLVLLKPVLHIGQVVFAWRAEEFVEYGRKLLAMIQCASVNASDGVTDR